MTSCFFVITKANLYGRLQGLFPARISFALVELNFLCKKDIKGNKTSRLHIKILLFFFVNLSKNCKPISSLWGLSEVSDAVFLRAEWRKEPFG